MMETSAVQLTAATILVAFAGVSLICFMKGAFGGGFSIVDVPELDAAMDWGRKLATATTLPIEVRPFREG